MARLTLTIQPFDGIEGIEEVRYCQKVSNQWQIEDTDLFALRADLGAGDLDYLPQVFRSRLIGAINAHEKEIGWRVPDRRLKSPDGVSADQLFQAMRLVWEGDSCADSVCTGVETRDFQGRTTFHPFPKPRRNVWGLVDYAHALGEGWKDESSWDCFDHLVSHGH